MEVPVTSHSVSRFGLLARLAALLGTSFFLVATSEIPYGPGGEVCNHPLESVVFHVAGTCGPEGDVTMTSMANDCGISVQGGGDVGLPTAGRFAGSDGRSPYSLTRHAWTLSGYLPEGAALPGSGPDAGFFGVERDAQAGPNPGQTPTVSHGALVKRECYNSYLDLFGVSCRDGSAAFSCEMRLVPR
jgi:hypothetical protein